MKEFEIEQDLSNAQTGDKVCCVINNSFVKDGTIHRGKSRSRGTEMIWICQDVINGDHSPDLHGHEFSWQVGDGSSRLLIANSVTLLPYGTDENKYLSVKQKIYEESRRKEEELRIKQELELKKAREKELEKNKKSFVPNVLSYFKRNSKDPLLFYNIRGSWPPYGTLVPEDSDYFVKVEEYELTENDKRMLSKYEGHNELDLLIIKILRMAKSYSSVNFKTLELETSQSRSRSAGDIWRHVLSVDPSITIFQVFTAMDRVYRGGNMYGVSYCSTVKKMVTSVGAATIDGKTGARIDEFGNEIGLWEKAEELYEEYLKEQKNKDVQTD